MTSEQKANINPLIIFGSSRTEGHTQKAVEMVMQGKHVPIVNLIDLKISYYDYEHKNQDDDFITLAEQMVNHNPLILASPIYWYSVSAIMKTFIDRWSDLLDIRKDIGRRLIGKEVWIIASYGGDMPRGFEDSIAQTCAYFKMQYRGCFYYYSGENQIRKSQNLFLAEALTAKIWPKELS